MTTEKAERPPDRPAVRDGAVGPDDDGLGTANTMEASCRFRPVYVTTMPNTMAQRQLVSMEVSGRPQETLLHGSRGLIRLSEEERPMVMCVPVMSDGQIDPRWGHAARVAIVDVEDGAVVGWREFAVAWDELHDVGTEGGHHARVARFLREQGVQTVLAHHMGPDMLNMLGRMGLTVRLGASGDARQAALAVAAPALREGQPPAK